MVRPSDGDLDGHFLLEPVSLPAQGVSDPEAVGCLDGDESPVGLILVPDVLYDAVGGCLHGFFLSVFDDDFCDEESRSEAGADN